MKKDMSQTPMSCLRDSNLLPSRGLVRISVNWLSVVTKDRYYLGFHKITDEMMLDVYMLDTRMLNKILGNINCTCVVIVDGHGFISETIVKEKFLHPDQLSATASNSNVLGLSN